MAGERNPSSGLLLLHAEHSAAPAGAQERQDGCRDELALAAAVPDQRQSDADRSAPDAWGAWDGVHQVEAADAVHPLPLGRDDAEKLADRERAVPVPGARRWRRERSIVRSVLPGAAEELCKPAAVQSGEQSCAVSGAEAMAQLAAHSGAEAQ